MIRSIIQKTVEGMSSPSPIFFHGERGISNRESDEFDFDIAAAIDANYAVYLDEPITAGHVFHQGGYVERAYAVVMLFLKKDDLESQPDEYEPLIDEMRSEAERFVLSLLANDDEIRFVDRQNVRTTDIIKEFDLVLTGVMLEVSITPRNARGCKTGSRIS